MSMSLRMVKSQWSLFSTTPKSRSHVKVVTDTLLMGFSGGWFRTFCDPPGVLSDSDLLAVDFSDGVASHHSQRQLVLETEERLHVETGLGSRVSVTNVTVP